MVLNDMPSIPLPFVVSLVLCLVLLRMVRQESGIFGLFPLLVAASAMQAGLIGLNWSFGWQPARLIQPIFASVLPALSFAAFDQLRRRALSKTGGVWLHVLPVAVVAALVIAWRRPIDVVLFAIYIGYGLALLRVAWLGPSALAAVRLSDEWTAHKALVAAAVLLIITAAEDAAISLALEFGSGQRAATILTVASVLWLAIAGYAATIADATRPDKEAPTSDDVGANPTSAAPTPRHPSSSQIGKTPSEADAFVLRRIDALMVEQHLYRDPDLTLERLARRAGLPARQISGALNRVHGRNVSQVVNEHRVGDARRRLMETRDPITTVMLDSGFGTKSNFYREFLRLTGMTPSAFRRAGGEGPALPGGQGVPATSGSRA